MSDLLKSEGDAAEEGERLNLVRRTDVTITRGHDRVKTLQVRLNEDEFAALSALADDRHMPVSTAARMLLLQALHPEDDLRAAFDRLEQTLVAVRRQVLRD
ncbi:MAG: hypothetical protein Q7T71_06340 [Herbiconiux sp.]|nr:hypothetical protein [Herbiconiux sp.]